MLCAMKPVILARQNMSEAATHQLSQLLTQEPGGESILRDLNSMQATVSVSRSAYIPLSTAILADFTECCTAFSWTALLSTEISAVCVVTILNSSLSNRLLAAYVVSCHLIMEAASCYQLQNILPVYLCRDSIP